MATDVVAIVIFQGEQQPSPVSVQCVNDDGARFVGRVVLWGAAVVVSVGSLSGCQLDVGLLTWSSLTPIDPLICSPLRASDDR